MRMRKCPECGARFRKEKIFKAHYEKMHKEPTWVYRGG